MTARRRFAESWLLAAGMFVVYIAVGYAWATYTAALGAPDALYHADTPRVIWNETSISHAQGRVVLHPLHVLMTVPVGIPLTAILGSRAFAAVIICAAFGAGTVFAMNALLCARTALPALERLGYSLLVGFAAGQFTFATVPETHVISGFFLALVALTLGLAGSERESALPQGARAWAHLFKQSGLLPALLASGAVITNVALVPVAVLVRFERKVPMFRKLRAAVVLSSALVVLLGACFVVQHVVFIRPSGAGGAAPSAAASAHAPAAVPAGTAPLGLERTALGPASAAQPAQASAPKPAQGWFRERFEREFRYVSWTPRRALEVAGATLLFNIYAPRSERYTLIPAEGGPPSELPAVRFDYFAFDMRGVGWLGAASWVLLIITAFAALAKRDDRAAFAQPATWFALAQVALFYAISNLYHVYPIEPAGGPNDVFLFAPNLVFPVVFLVAMAHAHGIVPAGARARLLGRGALLIALLAAATNTGLHMSDLLTLFS